MAPGSNAGTGLERARGVLDSGAALAKFLAICEAQGGFREPPRAAFTADVPAPASGRIAAINNSRLAKLAKADGAPTSPTAGLERSEERTVGKECVWTWRSRRLTYPQKHI